MAWRAVVDHERVQPATPTARDPRDVAREAVGAHGPWVKVVGSTVMTLLDLQLTSLRCLPKWVGFWCWPQC